MKKTLTILLVICSLGVMGQATTFDQDDFDILDTAAISFFDTASFSIINYSDEAFILSEPLISIEADGDGDTIYNFDGIVELIESKRDVVTLTDLMEYEQECYNDSTKFEGALFRMFDGTEFIGTRPKPYEHMTSYVKDTVIWSHKSCEFLGFITWLKAKYKID